MPSLEHHHSNIFTEAEIKNINKMTPLEYQKNLLCEERILLDMYREDPVKYAAKIAQIQQEIAATEATVDALSR